LEIGISSIGSGTNLIPSLEGWPTEVPVKTKVLVRPGWGVLEFGILSLEFVSPYEQKKIYTE
jgi:hypothetical protein